MISAPWSLQFGAIPYSLLPRRKDEKGKAFHASTLSVLNALRQMVPTHDFIQTARAEESGNFFLLFNRSVPEHVSSDGSPTAHKKEPWLLTLPSSSQ